MSKRFLGVLLFLTVIFFSVSANATVINITPSDDAWVGTVWSGGMFDHYEGDGNLTTMKAYDRSFMGYSSLFTSFMKFNLAPIADASVIQSAELWLYADYTAAGSILRTEHVSDDTWTESTISYPSQPSKGSAIAPDEHIVTTKNDGWVQITLDMDLWNEQSDLIDNALSLALSDETPNSSTQNIFYTKESQYSPYLKVTYASAGTVPEPTTLIMFGSGLFGLAVRRRK